MATTTRSKRARSAGETPSRRRAAPAQKSAFAWASSDNGKLLGAALAGVAIGVAANFGRKLLLQATSGATGDWADALATEHRMTLAIFDKIEETTDEQTSQRSHLLMHLKHALTKHAVEEESVIYPALREANHAVEADDLNGEHGYVKTYLYELETIPNDNPQWLQRVRDFRTMIEAHMREEEQDIFPALREQLTDEANAKLTAMMNKEGFKYG